MFRTLTYFLEMIRFSHTVFALPFALAAAALAWHLKGVFDVWELVGIVACMVFARSAAMGFNRLADREFDAKNPRTAGRHIPAGLLSVGGVWAFTVASGVLFLASTLLFFFRGNPWPLWLSPVVLTFIFLYSLTKRFTALAHFWLGASLCMAPVAAWIAIRGIPSFDDLLVPSLLGGAVLFWVAGFDILYACQDADFDREAKLRSIPAAIGVGNALRLAMLSHVVMFAFLLALAGASDQLAGWVFLGGVVLTGALVTYEHSLVRADDLSRVNRAFFQVNGVISIGLFVVVLVQLATGV